MTARRTIALVVATVASALGASCPVIGAKATGVSCQATAPIMDYFPTPRPWRWLGQGPTRRAVGLGVVRMGKEEETTFFFGRMHAGRPVAGYLDKGTIRLARAFTPAGAVIQPDPNRWEEGHAVVVLGSRAALATSRWFAARGNGAAASWYRDKARGILDGEPQ